MSGRRSPREGVPAGPRPDEIATHRFSLTFLGARPGEVRCSLLELGAALDRTRTALTRESLEVRALGNALEPASREIEELRAELIAVRAELAAYRDRRFTVEGELLAGGEGSRLAAAAKARADEIAAAAEQTAKATTGAARLTALDALRSARAAARAVRRSADLGAEARVEGPRAGGTPPGEVIDRPIAGARPPIGQRLPALVALFEDLALELQDALAGRDRGGAATAKRSGGTGDAVRAILTRISSLSSRDSGAKGS